jgi:transcriptional accessory protein Tex/SPT6
VKVKVLEVDIKRQRVALTMRLNDTPTRNTNPAMAGVFRQNRPKLPVNWRA